MSEETNEANVGREVRVFAPATVGNAVVGFDVLGFAIDGPGDIATVRRIEAPEVRLAEITGVVTELPEDPGENAATAGLIAFREDLGLEGGFEVSLEKGIPLGSGMGGSAASAVAAIVAANALVSEPLGDYERLLHYALIGEEAACGSAHPDNAAPCLLGGLVGAHGDGDARELFSIPVPDEICYVLVHPQMSLHTREAREVLDEPFEIEMVVEQMSHLAAFVAACHSGNLDLMGRAMRDVLVEPRRAALVPGFEEVQRAALDVGALGCSLAGAGPSVVAWCSGTGHAQSCGRAMRDAFAEHADLEARSWQGPIRSQGAILMQGDE
jgi:homoserine kinase